MSEIETYFNKYKGWIIVGLAALVLLTVYGYANGIRNDGISQERQLSAQYVDNQNYLSAFIAGFYEQFGALDWNRKALDQLLTNAVVGRYEASGGFSSNGALFSAIVEAYPDGALESFNANVGKY